jgi:PhnB protein
MSDAVKAVPDGFHTVTPYLVASDAAALIRFTEQAFDATPVSSHKDDNGTVAHAEIQIGDSRIMLGQGNAEWPPMPCMIHLYVEDADTVYRKALEAGGESVREMEDMFYGDRSGGVKDPTGNQWWIATHIEDVPPEEMARREEEQRARQAG